MHAKQPLVQYCCSSPSGALQRHTHTHTHNSSQPREGVATCREGGATCREVPRFAKLASVLRRAPPDAIARGLTTQMGDLDRVMEGSFGLLEPCAR